MHVSPPPHVVSTTQNWNDTHLFFFCGTEATSSIYGPFELHHRQWLQEHLLSLKSENDEGMTCMHDHIIFQDFMRRLIEMGAYIVISSQQYMDIEVSRRYKASFFKHKQQAGLRVQAAGLIYNDPNKEDCYP